MQIFLQNNGVGTYTLCTLKQMNQFLPFKVLFYACQKAISSETCFMHKISSTLILNKAAVMHLGYFQPYACTLYVSDNNILVGTKQDPTYADICFIWFICPLLTCCVGESCIQNYRSVMLAQKLKT